MPCSIPSIIGTSFPSLFSPLSLPCFLSLAKLCRLGLPLFRGAEGPSPLCRAKAGAARELCHRSAAQGSSRFFSATVVCCRAPLRDVTFTGVSCSIGAAEHSDLASEDVSDTLNSTKHRLFGHITCAHVLVLVNNQISFTKPRHVGFPTRDRSIVITQPHGTS